MTHWQPKCPQPKAQAGFSLMEVLVAFAVFSTAGLALLMTVTQSMRNANLAMTRALAILVAESQLADTLSNANIGIQTQTKTITQLDQTFLVEIVVQPGDIEPVLRVNVAVMVADDQAEQILAERAVTVRKPT